MKQAASQELFNHWNQVRGSRMEPERSELDPGAIRGVLADTFILEVDPQFQFPMRIAGTRIGALFATELKGKPFVDLWRSDARKPLLELLMTVIDDRSPAIAGIKAEPDGYQPLDLEMLLLPLRHFGKTHARIIGSMAPRFIPPWLGMAAIPGLALNSMRIIRRPADLAQLTSEGAALHGTRTPRYGHLVVHEGGAQDN